MKISVSAAGFDLTPSLKLFAERKIGSLDRFLERFELEGGAEVWVTISKTTRHHKHGNVFLVAADLRLPRRILRAQDIDDDVHASIDLVRNRLRQEIEKYKTRYFKIERSKKR